MAFCPLTSERSILLKHLELNCQTKNPFFLPDIITPYRLEFLYLGCITATLAYTYSFYGQMKNIEKTKCRTSLERLERHCGGLRTVLPVSTSFVKAIELWKFQSQDITLENSMSDSQVNLFLLSSMPFIQHKKEPDKLAAYAWQSIPLACAKTFMNGWFSLDFFSSC